ncbi:LysM peptidoglycan-binding domain-containing protein [uncultured Plantibacter sp.]|uniref:LysM peptidoglycan-binding domain-containing protein n=1 Tax=uncultured Plantibacter sp. TaxID=293337 RepID=UPI0028D85910|nr:LysM peptidoglycan-binding domain-containing protein [uncultured Plantibacter sp.]
MSAALIGSHRALPARTAQVPTSDAPSTRRLRLTKRGRVVFTTLAAIPLVIGVAVVGLSAGGAAANTAAGATFTYITVDPGESLWQLAESIAPDADPRDVIAEIMNLNQLSTAGVEPGQRLAIPHRYAAE